LVGRDRTGRGQPCRLAGAAGWEWTEELGCPVRPLEAHSGAEKLFSVLELSLEVAEASLLPKALPVRVRTFSLC
jgi:hypothetical protein